MDRQQWTFSDSAVGTSQGAGEQDSGTECQANATRLAGPIWASSPAAGNARGYQPVSRNLLPGRQLDPYGTDDRTRSYGPGAQSARASHQGCLCLSTSPQCPPTS